MESIEEYTLSISLININIFKYVHPYYMNNYRQTNKLLYYEYDNCKYQLLQTWCFPKLTISQIEKYLPDVNFHDIVELSLLYYPIPESVLYYDRFTLFYHACLANQSNPEQHIMITGDIFKDMRTSNQIMTFLWICYKFNRLDVIDIINAMSKRKFPAMDRMRNMILAKLEMKYEIEDLYFNIYTLVNASMMFTYEELMEILVIDSKLRFTNKYNTLAYIMGYEGSSLFPGMEDFLGLLVSRLSNESLLNIFNKFNIRDKWRIIATAQSELTIPKLYLNRELMETIIPLKHRDIYYITSGMYVEYINWKKLGNKITGKKQDKYFSIAPWGTVSINKDLSEVYKLPLDYHSSGKFDGNFSIEGITISKSF